MRTVWQWQYRWIAWLAVAFAAAFTAWALYAMAADLMHHDDGGPWLLYILYGLLLFMFWSFLGVLRWRSPFAWVVLIFLAIQALPLGIFTLLLRLADD